MIGFIQMRNSNWDIVLCFFLQTEDADGDDQLREARAEVVVEKLWGMTLW